MKGQRKISDFFTLQKKAAEIKKEPAAKVRPEDDAPKEEKTEEFLAKRDAPIPAIPSYGEPEARLEDLQTEELELEPPQATSTGRLKRARKFLDDDDGDEEESKVEEKTTQKEAAVGVPDERRRRRFDRQLEEALEGVSDDLEVRSSTPLEQQVQELQRAHPGVVLFVEHGYRYRFFGADAETAGRVLGILCTKRGGSASASIPVTHLDVHLRRMIEAGHQVGVVQQVETQAMRQNERRQGVRTGSTFQRRLVAVHSKATFLLQDAALENGCPPVLAVVLEADTAVAVVAATVSTSTIEYAYVAPVDAGRTRVSALLESLRPCEILVPESGVSKELDRVLRVLDPNSRGLRISYIPSTSTSNRIEASPFSPNPAWKDLPELVQQGMAALAHHLAGHQLESLVTSPAILRPLRGPDTVQFGGAAIADLGLVEGDGVTPQEGSLFWLLNRTETPFGARLLRRWVVAPPADPARIVARQEVVARLVGRQSEAPEALVRLLEQLRQVGDLERIVARAQVARASPQDMHQLFRGLSEMWRVLPTAEEAATQALPPLLCETLLREPLEPLASALELFRLAMRRPHADLGLVLGEEAASLLPSQFPAWAELQASLQKVAEVEAQLALHLHQVRETLRLPQLEYVQVADKEYLVELPRGRPVPDHWLAVQSTSKLVRYHTADVQDLLPQRTLHRDLARLAAGVVWQEFQRAFCRAHAAAVRAWVHSLAELDVLHGFAKLADLQPGYVRPELLEGPEEVLWVEAGRHPVAEVLLSTPFVPNDVQLGVDHSSRALLLTGPNMGGKSLYLRMAGTLVIMAQLGAWVPAARMRWTPVDAIFTRMGARDALDRGQSTFFVEMAETAESLRSASAHSLLLFDELGRGTSTHDGVAIAAAALEFVMRVVHCRTLFVSHYPQLAVLLGHGLRAAHMGYLRSDEEGPDRVTLLYSLREGVAEKSFGLNVAALAGIPDGVLREAKRRAEGFERGILPGRA